MTVHGRTDDAQIDDAQNDAAETGPRSRPRALLIGLAVTALVLSGVLIGVLLTPDGARVAVPASDSVDVGFAQDMSLHHNQAIEMSAMALGRSTDPVIRTLAFDVLTSQQSQVGTMQGWLTLWDRPYLPDGPPMTWMTEASSTEGHPMDMSASANDSGQDARSMPGMASTAELTALRRMNAEEFDGRYLQLLRRHHRGGIPMAELGAANATVPAVAALAGSIASTQTAEVGQIDALLSAHGVSPLPES
ncbi:hypothetical protein CH262_14445 [Rhodococcus sp. 05-2255-1e]|uniref:DUF305 domain-containing protein n=1 Tax=unclassified Rhodococcus (in: high G+C Gram-positive bacteria) TaxID=192944 RepID=UPI000B9BEE12|nr:MULTISPECIES: DUF305 domain-containing protein [unclassified Rhodococcus (in: high G+C Gram-positive bacteria)]OZC94846.1 hypothetical protein CH275_28185 [Rhodococcus sp. 06-235-1A]OZD64730.1 hypothetical protein CH271_20970 [Rhodococcus sp. 05-340-2]OZD71668.1 hypothetical protein CH272_24125 [Rhodococcus sp. 05-340-1]OZE24030.1 hypothetical protein CH262_14445 [Rhodococcus sp. 05-2255-1e]